MERPICFHVPKLFKGEPVTLSWCPVSGASTYIIECSEDGITWQQLWVGEGEEAVGPGIGYSWSELDSLQLDWQQVEGLDCCWEDWEAMFVEGQSWNSLDAQHKTWAELDSEISVQQSPDSSLHKCCTVTLPSDKNRIALRLRATAAGVSSEPIETAVCPLFYSRSCIMQFEKSEIVHMQVDLDHVNMLGAAVYTLCYDPQAVQLHNVKLSKSVASAINWGNIPLKILIHTAGKLVFAIDIQSSAGTLWSGIVLHAAFEALHTGRTTIQLIQESN